MYLTISKKFEISLSYRWWQKDWPAQRNRAFYGPAAGGPHGYGANASVHFVFHGPVDPENGMVINVAEVKERVGGMLAARYDHRYLNVDTRPFDEVVPTPENIARQLWADAQPLFGDAGAGLAAVHLEMSPLDSATAYADGRVERGYGLEFSAARRTWSPRLTEEENTRLFGAAASPSGHGHCYYLRATAAGEPDRESGMIVAPETSGKALAAVFQLLDHRNLVTDVPELAGRPLTTESLSGFLFARLANRMPLARMRLWENPYFYTDCLPTGVYVMGVRADFRAAHRLASPRYSREENERTYGKCTNAAGHGHRYVVEAAIDGYLDEASGALYPLEDLTRGVRTAVAPWDYVHLDEDTDEFAERPSTGENIVSALWPKVEDALGRPLYRLRLWETPNNRFTLRRETPGGAGR
ncbi:MAG TPA: 6-carboxytetrahydropterin synthase [candidate division Zixibacteria bacterium]|nr:6-carboxytetrahydropterin synthase [candidate division Zixibacteria bacterium]MDD4916205.1 6-carboxytetrahydropterin synthase [candidate division Zixibacteria bacterium]MDM7974151.1 6-carboxytetrahydropterin synthase [candidate division Zixibacteria bacterium]HOD66913.1 6-carboxytetrahydropterin synthase [candidate division Zixibacteria bacterium]HPM37510.1 6-carboxytetrahydropterin synthase [candidate division Zixibacteria bacterium]